MELSIGMIFKSKWFEGTTKILSINKENNSLEVEIFRSTGSHSEDWNLQHTIWGFENADYKMDYSIPKVFGANNK